MNSKIFDSSVLEDWKQIDPENWKKIATSILNTYFSCNQFEDLNAAWISQDLDLVKKAAHTLKSSCGSVGAQRAHEILVEVERLCTTGEFKKVGDALVSFRDAFSKTRHELETYKMNTLDPR